MEISIEDAPWMLSDQGWRPLAETSLLPLPSNPIVLDANLLREHATFPAYSEGLDTRSDSIKRLSDQFGIDDMPSETDQATTIEAAARAAAQNPRLDWGYFWQDVCDILDNDLSHLQGKDVPLCTDGTLNSGGVPGRAIYFRPRQGGQDDESPDEPGIDQVPASLQSFIAILDPKIPVSEVRDGRRQNTDLHKRLTDAKLVNTFRREDVLTDILTPNLRARDVRDLVQDDRDAAERAGCQPGDNAPDAGRGFRRRLRGHEIGPVGQGGAGLAVKLGATASGVAFPSPFRA
jgi:hypothetical protein